jgi:ABC-type multidrug transport system ATPase subunit
MPEPFVQVQHVGKTIKGQEIIRDFHISIREGEVIALCGGNGAGKSTILRMMAGIIHPSRGEITVGGFQWKTDRRRYAELIGYMPDDYRFSAGLTAKETLLFWAKLRGAPASRVDEALAEVGLEQTGAKPVASFSKGMRQRILFAQAMISRPRLLLMDEPTNGLDPYWMDTFVKLVRQAADQGQTVLFSTHQLQVAEALADRVVFLRGGAVQLEGSGEEIRSRLGAAGLAEAFGEWYAGVGNSE